MNKSAEIGKLAEALAKAQAEIKGAIKDSNNPFYKSSYANLESVVDACKEALSKNGISYSQVFDYQEGVDFLETVLMHSSGQWISGRQRMLSKDQTAQGMGSAASYNRRYGLAAICGVVQTDDDGNEASGKVAPQQQRPQQPMSRPMGR
jgi:hypothetical protein